MPVAYTTFPAYSRAVPEPSVQPAALEGKIVAEALIASEADIKSGRISVSSPIARALIGKTEGDIAEVLAPAGKRSYEILDVRYQ